MSSLYLLNDSTTSLISFSSHSTATEKTIPYRFSLHWLFSGKKSRYSFFPILNISILVPSKLSVISSLFSFYIFKSFSKFSTLFFNSLISLSFSSLSFFNSKRILTNSSYFWDSFFSIFFKVNFISGYFFVCNGTVIIILNSSFIIIVGFEFKPSKISDRHSSIDS